MVSDDNDSDKMRENERNYLYAFQSLFLFTAHWALIVAATAYYQAKICLMQQKQLAEVDKLFLSKLPFAIILLTNC